ncbi:MAG: hypothetical protein RIC80_02455 [Cyclobacteriaceae bacterium]
MKYLVLFLLFAQIFVSCDDQQKDQPPESGNSSSYHRPGDPSDPPPCPTCQDIIGSKSKDSLNVVSFENYEFLMTMVGTDSIYYLTHSSSIDTRTIQHNTRVKAQFSRYYVLDCDTMKLEDNSPDSLIYFPTGTELDLAENVKADSRGDYYYISKSKLTDGMNRLKIDGLRNAGYVVGEIKETINDGYLSQNYYFLGSTAEEIKEEIKLRNTKFYMHVEPMVVMKKIAPLGKHDEYDSSYNMMYAVDILISNHEDDDYRFHALGNYQHSHPLINKQHKH